MTDIGEYVSINKLSCSLKAQTALRGVVAP